MLPSTHGAEISVNQALLQAVEGPPVAGPSSTTAQTAARRNYNKKPKVDPSPGIWARLTAVTEDWPLDIVYHRIRSRSVSNHIYVSPSFSLKIYRL